MSAYLLRDHKPTQVVLSDEALDALPPLFEEIVLHQRELEAFCSQPLVKMREAQNMMDRRNMLAREAEKKLSKFFEMDYD